MARISVEIELDWLAEDGDIDAAVKDEIINGIVHRVSSGIEKQVTEKVQERIEVEISDRLDEKVNEITDQLLNRRFDMTDRYGRIVAENTSVVDQLVARLDNFLEEKVDGYGKTGGYQANQTRFEYLINKNIDHRFKAALDDAVAKVKAGLEQHMRDTIKQQLGDRMAELIGLDKLTKLQLPEAE